MEGLLGWCSSVQQQAALLVMWWPRLAVPRQDGGGRWWRGGCQHLRAVVHQLQALHQLTTNTCIDPWPPPAEPPPTLWHYHIWARRNLGRVVDLYLPPSSPLVRPVMETAEGAGRGGARQGWEGTQTRV